MDDEQPATTPSQTESSGGKIQRDEANADVQLTIGYQYVLGPADEAIAGDDPVGVFEVRPGIIRTDMTARVSARYDGMIAQGVVPMRRWGEPDDVAAVVAEVLAQHAPGVAVAGPESGGVQVIRVSLDDDAFRELLAALRNVGVGGP